MDRGHQNHQNFGELQKEQKHFVCPIKGNTNKTCLEKYYVKSDSMIFYDHESLVLFYRDFLGKSVKNKLKNLFVLSDVLLMAQHIELPPTGLI